jgi:hypothetical protein
MRADAGTFLVFMINPTDSIVFVQELINLASPGFAATVAELRHLHNLVTAAYSGM